MPKKIKLVNSDECAIVDDDLYDYLKQYHWFLATKSNGQQHVVRIWIDPKTGEQRGISMAEEVIAIDLAKKKTEQN